MRLGRLSEFGFDLVNHSVLEIVLVHAKAALGSGGRVNLDRKTEGGIVIVEAAVRATRGGRSFCLLQTYSSPPFYFVRSSQLLPRVCPRILLGGRRLAMDSVPQKLIDAIMGNVPQFNLPSCSLVAKRWRRKSQKRVLGTILLSSEGMVKRWCADIPRDSDVEDIHSWTEPALFSRMLGSLSSLTTLPIFAAKIPDEF